MTEMIAEIPAELPVLGELLASGLAVRLRRVAFVRDSDMEPHLLLESFTPSLVRTAEAGRLTPIFYSAARIRTGALISTI